MYYIDIGRRIMIERSILCIDLKSFFASVECVERGIDGFKVPLVVCDPTRNGAITLAVSPYLKNMGVKGRCRVYDLPKDIDIIKVPPRMRLYQNKSKEVINIFLDYIAAEDLHVYSIDESFLDVTDYLHLYNKNAYELATDILNTIYEKTHLTATAGIGPNMLLAKVSMDIEAKHNKDNIAMWTYQDVKDKLWNIKPLSKMWGIGRNLERSLNNLGCFKVGDIALLDINILRKKFGVIGEDLWLHANGIDNTIIKDLHKVERKDKSFSHSQILFKDYYDYNIKIIIYEMIDVLCRRLRNKKVLCQEVYLGISYSHTVGGGFYHSIKLNSATNDTEELYRLCIFMFQRYYTDHMPIRKVSLAIGRLSPNNQRQLNLFESYDELKKKEDMNNAIDDIALRFGKNAILKASSLLEDSTIKERNGKIGGHHA